MFIKIRVVYILMQLCQPGRKSMKTKIFISFLCPSPIYMEEVKQHFVHQHSEWGTGRIWLMMWR